MKPCGHGGLQDDTMRLWGAGGRCHATVGGWWAVPCGHWGHEEDIMRPWKLAGMPCDCGGAGGQYHATVRGRRMMSCAFWGADGGYGM